MKLLRFIGFSFRKRRIEIDCLLTSTQFEFIARIIKVGEKNHLNLLRKFPRSYATINFALVKKTKKYMGGEFLQYFAM